MIDKACVHYTGMQCVRSTCTTRNSVRCCWECHEPCEHPCRPMKPATTGRRELGIGDKIPLMVEVMQMVNYTSDYGDVLVKIEGTTRICEVTLDVDDLIRIKYGLEGV